MIKVGVLGLQGDAREHCRTLASLDATPVVVKTPEDVAGIDALVIPGGESTTIGKLLTRFDLLGPIRDRAHAGLPLYGTCAGLILMAKEVVGDEAAPHRLEVLDATVRRNAYGRQADSFEADLAIEGMDDPFRAVFIRAPVVERVGAGVEVLASWDDRPVLVREGHLLASAFHPEMTSDARIHALFLQTLEKV